MDGKQGTVTGSDGITVNSNNNITINKNELLNIIKTDLLNIIYPVGAIYISIDSTSPATLFGGSWTKIDDGYYLRASAGGGGEILGEQLPNITGSIYLPHPINAFGSQNGAFTGSIENSGNYLNYGSSNQPGRRFTFKASNSNSIYTDNGVVRPKSIKVYMWKRTN